MQSECLLYALPRPRRSRDPPRCQATPDTVGKVMKTSHVVVSLAAALGCGLAGAEPVGTQSATFYVQQSWPKQSNTNDQIQQINDLFGTDFDDWSDVPNLAIGAQWLLRVAAQWKVGVQLDYSQGSITGSSHVATEAGPAKLEFDQTYQTYADVYAAAKFFPWPAMARAQPFAYGAVGIAYESDTTTLKLRNDYLDESLRVENSGWFPTYTAGIGVEVPFSADSPWYGELGVAYAWGRMTNVVPAKGSLAPAPKVTADTDMSGPNYWIGFGRRF